MTIVLFVMALVLGAGYCCYREGKDVEALGHYKKNNGPPSVLHK
jgi:hypothetical protein